MKKHGTTILFVLIFFVGLGLLLYPTVSDWWNSQHQSRAIVTYSENVSDMKDEAKAEEIKKARIYNNRISTMPSGRILSDKELNYYNKVLNITDSGIMAYLEIPSINVSLPVYHGIEESVLQVAVGHLEWTSLPVGGESTHCVVSGHRGLPSAKLLTNLDKLVVGDVFMIYTLDEMLTYQVDQILIVEPYDISALEIIPGRDLLTLVTCTPYGINSHRLLVRGHRIENPKDTPEYNIVSEASQIDPVIVAPIVAMPILAAFLVYVLIRYRRKR